VEVVAAEGSPTYLTRIIGVGADGDGWEAAVVADFRIFHRTS
jgi:hypothetical protein